VTRSQPPRSDPQTAHLPRVAASVRPEWSEQVLAAVRSYGERGARDVPADAWATAARDAAWDGAPIDVVLVDVERFGAGAEVFSAAAGDADPIPAAIVVLTSRIDPAAARCLDHGPGAVALVPWPAPAEWLAAVLLRAAQERRMWIERRELWRALVPDDAGASHSPALEHAVAAPDATLYIAGGDAVTALRTARWVHSRGARRGGPFVVLGAIDPPALEAAWHDALGGTLWVPDVDRLPPATQAQLAQFLGAQPPSGRRGASAGVRVIASGPRDLEAAERGMERVLVYRLNVLAIDLSAGGPAASGSSATPPTPDRLDQLERRHVEEVLAACGGNRSAAARRLGLHRATLHAKLRRWQQST